MTINSKPKRVAYFPKNIKGRDFVVGDIHGMFSAFEALLRKVSFNSEIDRVFSVGDLIDRGAESARMMEFIDKPWFFTVLGNHEMLLLEAQESEDEYQLWMDYNGGRWWESVADDQRQIIISAIEQLPIVIEVVTDSGNVGIVHADVEYGMDWQMFTAAIEENDRLHFDTVWSRRRLFYYDTHGSCEGVEGIDKVVFGHTPKEKPVITRNLYYIDTGAVYQMETRGKLTLMQIQPEIEFFTYDIYGRFFY